MPHNFSYSLIRGSTTAADPIQRRQEPSAAVKAGRSFSEYVSGLTNSRIIYIILELEFQGGMEELTNRVAVLYAMRQYYRGGNSASSPLEIVKHTAVCLNNSGSFILASTTFSLVHPVQLRGCIDRII